MKHKLLGSLFIWICCLTLGMGSMGEPVSVKTPEPDINFRATVVDQDDVSLELEKFSFNGKTYITGKMGKAELSIDFEKIRSILFVKKDGRITAMVTLDNQQKIEDDQQKIELFLEQDAPCFGTSSFADVRIAAGDIKSVVIHGTKQEKE